MNLAKVLVATIDSFKKTILGDESSYIPIEEYMVTINVQLKWS